MLRFMPEKSPDQIAIEQMSQAEVTALALGFLEQIKVMHVAIEQLQQELRELKSRQGKDSHNSSKPPSSDGLQRRSKSLRQASERPVGGQPGHKGNTLKKMTQVDHIVDHLPPPRCAACGASLEGHPRVQEKETRQVIDLPPLRLEVTEHRVFRTRCTCGAAQCGSFPVELVSAVQYGPKIRAAGVYLNQYQHIPFQRCADAMGELLGVALSAGSVASHVRQASQQLAPAVAQIARTLIGQAVVHFDETGLRLNGGNVWLHSASTADRVWYGHHPKRGKVAMDALGILPQYHGIAVHDGLPSYRAYDCLHALCNAHHLRELVYIFESTEQAWADDMGRFLCALKDEVAHSEQPLSAGRYREVSGQYHDLIRRGLVENPERVRQEGKRRGRVKQSDAYNLLGRLYEHEEDILRFATDLRVPFDNNQAERDIRMSKLKQKISGCFRSDAGMAAFCIIRSYLATLRKNRISLYRALVNAFTGNVLLPVS